MNFELITQIVAVVNTIALVAGGVYLTFNKISVDRRREADILDQETVSNLKTNVDAFKDQIKILEAELVKVREDYQKAMQEIARLTGENSAMTTLLQGKDELTREFYTKSIQNMKLTEETVHKFDTFLIDWNVHTKALKQFIGEAIEFRNNVEKLTLERRKIRGKRLTK